MKRHPVYLQLEHVPPGGCVIWKASLLQEVQALVQHCKLGLLEPAGSNEDAVDHEDVYKVLGHCGLQV